MSKSVLDIIIGLQDKTSGGLKTIGGNLKSFGDGVKKAFNSAPVRAFRNAIVGLGAALVGAIVEASKFNIEMARTWTMAGGGIETFKNLRSEARELASDFGKARSEIAKGMYNALSAGIDKSNLQSFMRTAAKVAVADGSDVSVAVDGITTVLNAFKVKAEETEAVTDKLFKTVAMGKTTFGDLASNLATVAPIAAASNIPLEQILAHVAALTAQGTPTAQAMTQIRASIMGLNKALGDGWSGTMSYQDALKKVWQNAGQSQTELLKLVGSSEAVQAVLGGVGINAEMASEKLKGMADTAGAAQEAFEKVNQFRHWPTLIETARGTLSKFGEELDQRIAPYVERVTQSIRKWRDDQEVWSGVTTFLDNADSRIREIVDMIQGPEDILTLGATMAEKFTAYILTKAGEVGRAIGDGVLNSIPGVKSLREISGSTKEQTNGFLDKMSFGKLGEMQSDQRAAEINISQASQQSFAEAFAAKLQEKRNPAGESAQSLADLLSAGLTGEQMDAALAGMELTAEELQRLVENVNHSGEAAKKTAESATKSAEAAVESNTKVTAAMDRSKDAALSAAQAAERNLSISEHTLTLMSALASRFAQTEQRLAQAEGQIRSMRA